MFGLIYKYHSLNCELFLFSFLMFIFKLYLFLFVFFVSQGWTAVMVAVVNDNIECLKLLIAAKADLNLQDKDVSFIYLNRY